MKTIKEGKIPENIIRFDCDYCQTIFEATESECVICKGKLIYEYYYDCPICGINCKNIIDNES